MIRRRVSPILSVLALVLLAGSYFLTGCSQDQKAYGNPISVTEKTNIAEIVNNPAQYHDKIVRVEGVVGQVCQDMGCWFDIQDGTGKIRIDLRMGISYTIPKKSSGKRAVIEGRVQADGSAPVHIIGIGTTLQ